MRCIVVRAVKRRSFYIPCCVYGKLGESMKWTEILLIRADEAEQFCYPLQGENRCKYVCFVRSMHCKWSISFIKACSVNGTIVEPFIFRAANEEAQFS